MALRSLRLPKFWATSRHHPPATTSNLPTELLLTIFEELVRSSNLVVAYHTLLSAALVCTRWTAAAQSVLFAYPEPLGEHKATSLANTLTATSHRTGARRLAVGVSEQLELTDNLHWEGAIRSTTLNRLLALNLNIRVLVLIHCDIRSINSHYTAPSNLGQLTSLVEVTFASATLISPVSVDDAFLSALPPSVRFLNLPTYTLHSDRAPLPYPSFRLSGLTVSEYPGPLTTWLLTRSADTLERLTVGALYDPSTLHRRHPNIRSLNVIETPSLNVYPDDIDAMMSDYTPSRFPTRILTDLFHRRYNLHASFTDAYVVGTTFETQRALCSAAFKGHDEWVSTIYPQLRFEEHQRLLEDKKEDGGFGGWLRRQFKSGHTSTGNHIVTPS